MSYCLPVVEIGFNPILYSVDEDSGVVEFSVKNKNVDLEREVTVQFDTVDKTATGKISHLPLVVHSVLSSLPPLTLQLEETLLLPVEC